MIIAQLVNTAFNVVFWVIILTIFLSWIPNVDWQNPFLRAFRSFTDAILSPFRSIIPPINGLDLSPIIALIVLQLVQAAVVRVLIIMHLYIKGKHNENRSKKLG